MTVRVGINGFGSIGRRFFRIVHDRADIEVVAVNDLTNPATLAHLLKYDTNYGRFEADVSATDDAIVAAGRTIRVLAEKEPARLPWRELGVDIVIESTGRFTDGEAAKAHLAAGAKKVIISAPAKNEDVTVVLGVNETSYQPAEHHIISNASCTTNCLAPVVRILDDAFGVEHGLMTTVHSYTNDQHILDLPHRDLRRARAAALNIIPTTTGAARAVGKVLPHLNGKLNGMSVRVPTPTVSLCDVVVKVRQPTAADAVNDAFRAAAAGALSGVIGFTDEALVSMDFKGSPLSAIVDGESTMVMNDMVKVVAWYDNEWGYSARLADLVVFIARQGL